MDLNDHKSKKVANWLLLGVFMTVIQIALGGITRLTGSGLSITEWDVVTGTLPPMSETTWQELFAKYKTTPQFQLLNFDFTVANFKFIFFWEWFHRLWARTIGLVFAFGFIYFLSKEFQVPVQKIKSIVLGGHGDSMVAMLGHTQIEGKKINDLVKEGKITKERLDEIVDRTKKGGAEIVKYLEKGSAFYAPAASGVEMAESYLKDLKKLSNLLLKDLETL